MDPRRPLPRPEGCQRVSENGGPEYPGDRITLEFSSQLSLLLFQELAVDPFSTRFERDFGGRDATVTQFTGRPPAAARVRFCQSIEQQLEGVM